MPGETEPTPRSRLLTVSLRSFSFRDGYPVDGTGHGGGFVFDCRLLPNPGRDERLSPMTGRDLEVATWLESSALVRSFLEAALAILVLAVNSYRELGYERLSVAFGCTGGRHRSVYCAESAARALRERGGVAVELVHERAG